MASAKQYRRLHGIFTWAISAVLSACLAPKYDRVESFGDGGGKGGTSSGSVGDGAGTSSRTTSSGGVGGSAIANGGVAGNNPGASGAVITEGGSLSLGGSTGQLLGGATSQGGTTAVGPEAGGITSGGTLMLSGGATNGGISASTGGTTNARGGTTSAGTTSTGGGNGGATTGGKATGGATIGGAATGGVATGGVATGGKATGGVATGGVATGGVATGGTSNTVPTGTDGFTTRYWDCCKPSCAWTANAGGKTPVKSCAKDNSLLADANAKSACESGGTSFLCWDYSPWADDSDANLAYGYAAYNNIACGTCFELQFTGACKGGGTSCSPLLGKRMIVQVINIGAIAANQFDLLIPGGGVGAMNACTNQWGTTDLGTQYGGYLSECSGSGTCTQNKCSSVFSGRDTLLNGCSWLVSWLKAADNPVMKYHQVTCPAAITAKSGMPG